MEPGFLRNLQDTRTALWKIKSHSFSFGGGVFYPFMGLQIPLILSYTQINNWKRIES